MQLVQLVEACHGALHVAGNSLLKGLLQATASQKGCCRQQHLWDAAGLCWLGGSSVQSVRFIEAPAAAQHCCHGGAPAVQDRTLQPAWSLSGQCHLLWCCRAGAYADAVEEYTLAVSLDPAAVPAYTNRAAAYLKLKEWQAAVTDCDLALILLQGEPGVRQPGCHCPLLTRLVPCSLVLWWICFWWVRRVQCACNCSPCRGTLARASHLLAHKCSVHEIWSSC